MNGGVLGVFAEAERVAPAVRTLQEHGLEVADVYTPVHLEEVVGLLRPRPSPVRVVTFLAGTTGAIFGLWLALWSTGVWDLIVDGKPYYSVVPYMVVAFEGTILLGAVFTTAALLVLARLPQVRFPARAYRPEFSADRFGVWLTPPKDKREEARELLRQCGAVEVQNVEEP